MKSSRFNITYICKDYYVIFNTKTKNIIKFPCEQKDLLDSILQGSDMNDFDSDYNVLYEKGFFIADEVDELKEMCVECQQLVDSNILYLTIMPTYTCNLACTYCFQHHVPGSIINWETVDKIIKVVEKNINKYTGLYVEWFGGEPLIAKEQVLYMNQKFKEICQNIKLPYVSRITTNGYYLDLNTFKQLQQNNCFVYYISVDGNKELHDKQRPCKNGDGSYDIIMKNLKKIKNAISSRNFRIEIRVNCSYKSYDDFNKFLSKYERIFGRDSRFSLVIETINDWSNRTDDMKKSGLLLENTSLLELAEIAKQYDVNLASHSQYLLNTQICQAAKKNAYSIFYDGTLHKCQMAQESKEYYEMDEIGEITEEGKFEVDDQKVSIWVSNDLLETCKTCKLLPLCFGKKCVFQTRIKVSA